MVFFSCQGLDFLCDYHPPPPPPPPPPPEDPPPPLPELEPGAVEADEMALLNEFVNEEAASKGRMRGIAEVPEPGSLEAAARTSANCSDQACSTPRASA